MRILLVSNYYPEHVGGIETVAATLAAGYRRHGHEVRWIAGDLTERPHTGPPDDVPIKVWNLTERLGFPYPLAGPGSASTVRKHVSWCEVVHLHDCLYALNLTTLVAARRSKHRPVLLTQHIGRVPFRNPALRGLQALAYASLGRAALSSADQVVFVSQEVSRWFAPRVRFRRPPVVVENGVDIELFTPAVTEERRALRGDLGVESSGRLLLFVGRFVEKKGIRLLRPVIEATPQWKWLLVGRAGDEDPTRWRLQNLRVLAPVEPRRLRDHYAAADLLVLPSVGEGFPVVAQEAMACGTPVLLAAETAAGLPNLHDVVFT
ncbi:MAG: glycosyltransferase family 4 protein, partial [Candidatus Dormibacteraeota bacterium]|nr:glycosyltransferase family 4 protein [Candidatus Dormibacteraeota bacterium]